MCRACGSAYVGTGWRSLPVVERISANEMSRLVRGWPERTYIEVRLCGRCGETITSRREVGEP